MLRESNGPAVETCGHRREVHLRGLGSSSAKADFALVAATSQSPGGSLSDLRLRRGHQFLSFAPDRGDVLALLHLPNGDGREELEEEQEQQGEQAPASRP